MSFVLGIDTSNYTTSCALLDTADMRVRSCKKLLPVKQVQEMTKTMLHLKSIPKPDDTADAVAIAITHGLSVNTRRVMKNFEEK